MYSSRYSKSSKDCDFEDVFNDTLDLSLEIYICEKSMEAIVNVEEDRKNFNSEASERIVLAIQKIENQYRTKMAMRDLQLTRFSKNERGDCTNE